MNNDIKEQSLSVFLKGKLREIMNQHADHMATGACKDFSEYQKMAGVIEGLALAEREVLDWTDKHYKKRPRPLKSCKQYDSKSRENTYRKTTNRFRN